MDRYSDPLSPSRLPGQRARRVVRPRAATLRAVSALMIREMATRYGQSPGGYLWALLEPLGGTLIISIGFSLILRNPPLGNSFVLFYATGVLPFTLYQSVSVAVGRSVQFSRALLKYPAVTWVDAVLARFALNALTGLLASVLVAAGVLVFTDSRVALDAGPIVLSFALAMLTGLGVGVLNCALFGLFPVWVQVWSILTRPLFLASGIFFLYGDMPRLGQDILWWNPLIHVVGLMREGVYPTYGAEYLAPLYVVAVGMIALFFGVLLMARYHRVILSEMS